MKNIFTYVLLSLALVSCKDELKIQESSVSPDADPVATNVTQPGPSPVTNAAAAPMQSGAINPPHGQPGHDCAVAVGAPLPASSGMANTQPTTITPAVTKTPVATPQATSTAPGMNPPHGQPGHKCEIPVGAPLTSASKPASTNTAGSAKISTATINSDGSVTPSSNTTITTKSGTSSTPALLQPPTTNKTASGMNPAHGQPGHRCDVAVGAPLP